MKHQAVVKVAAQFLRFRRFLASAKFGVAGLGVGTYAAWGINPTAGKFTLAGCLVLVDLAVKT